MKHSFDTDIQNPWCGYGFPQIGNNDKIPMHPDDFDALLSWIRARRIHDEENEQLRPVKTGNCLHVG